MTKKIKKALISGLLCLSLLFALSGCSVALPGEKAMAAPEMPTPDAEGMISVGTKLKMPYTVGEFRLDEHKEALSASGYFYDTWVTGEPTDYTNSNSEAAKLYDAEIFAIVYEGTDADDALSKTAGWLAAARQRYEVKEEDTFEFGGNTYTVLSYLTPGETSPFEGGISAFRNDGSLAVCIELHHTAAWKEDQEASLKTFLNCIR